MKYFKFEYDYKLQKLLWIVESICTGFLYPLVAMTIIVCLPKLSEAICTALLFLSIIFGFIAVLYNVFKRKGVYLFENHMEISYHYTRKIIIIYSDISSIENFTKHTGKYYFDFKGGGRKNCISLFYGENCKRIFFKVENQEELMDFILNKIQNNNI